MSPADGRDPPNDPPAEVAKVRLEEVVLPGARQARTRTRNECPSEAHALQGYMRLSSCGLRVASAGAP